MHDPGRRGRAGARYAGCCGRAAPLHVLEHGLAPDRRVAAWQHRLDPLQGRVAGGCHLSRDVPALLAAAGLEVGRLEQDYLPGPGPSKPWGYVSLVTAVRA